MQWFDFAGDWEFIYFMQVSNQTKIMNIFKSSDLIKSSTRYENVFSYSEWAKPVGAAGPSLALKLN